VPLLVDCASAIMWAYLGIPMLVTSLFLSNFMWTVEGQTYGDYCPTTLGFGTRGCVPNSGLICRNGICDCLYSWMVFRIREAKCFSTVGKTCHSLEGSGGCLENSSCDRERDLCICDPGYVQLSGRACTDPLANSGIAFPIICCKANEGDYARNSSAII